MNWIDLSERDKLFNYAKKYSKNTQIFDFKSSITDSYYTDSKDEKVTAVPPVIEYTPNDFGEFKKSLLEMWEKSDFEDIDLLATIVSVASFKNFPQTGGNDIVQDKSQRPISKNDSPPEFVYEF